MSVKEKQFPVPLKHFFGKMSCDDFKLSWSIMVINFNYDGSVLLLLFTFDNVA